MKITRGGFPTKNTEWYVRTWVSMERTPLVPPRFRVLLGCCLCLLLSTAVRGTRTQATPIARIQAGEDLPREWARLGAMMDVEQPPLPPQKRAFSCHTVTRRACGVATFVLLLATISLEVSTDGIGAATSLLRL